MYWTKPLQTRIWRVTREKSQVVKLKPLLGVSPTKKPKPQKGYLRAPHQASSTHFHCKTQAITTGKLTVTFMNTIQSVSWIRINEARWLFSRNLTTFKLSIFLRGSWGSSVNWFEPKIEPPSANLAWQNAWNALSSHCEIYKKHEWLSFPFMSLLANLNCQVTIVLLAHPEMKSSIVVILQRISCYWYESTGKLLLC